MRDPCYKYELSLDYNFSKLKMSLPILNEFRVHVFHRENMVFNKKSRKIKQLWNIKVKGISKAEKDLSYQYIQGVVTGTPCTSYLILTAKIRLLKLKKSRIIC